MKTEENSLNGESYCERLQLVVFHNRTVTDKERSEEPNTIELHLPRLGVTIAGSVMDAKKHGYVGRQPHLEVVGTKVPSQSISCELSM